MKNHPIKTLHDQVEFNCPFRVHRNKTVTAEHSIYAPEDVLDGEISGPWELLNGYSGQDRYAGPIMHNSEYLGGALEEDILNTPGVYVLLQLIYSPEEDAEDPEEYIHEGWAIARYKGKIS
jgi:hypothetical protein